MQGVRVSFVLSSIVKYMVVHKEQLMASTMASLALPPAMMRIVIRGCARALVQVLIP